MNAMIPNWPASLDAREAVQYTGLAPRVIERAARDGEIAFKRLGPRGRKVCLRTQLDAFLSKLWQETSGEALDDMDFGPDGDS